MVDGLDRSDSAPENRRFDGCSTLGIVSSIDADLWERAAPLYDLQRVLERRALRVLAGMLESAGALRGPVLDLGTGTGAMLQALSERPEPPAVVVGMDSSRGMLSRVGPLPAGWRVEYADARALPCDAGSLEAVSAAYLLHVLEPDDRRTVLAETRCVLRPGGMLGTVTIAPWAGLVTPLLSASSRRAMRSIGPLAGMRILDPRPELLAAGFEPVSARTVRRGYPSLCVVSGRR